MPTTRPRYSITETDEVAAALDAAARRWPEDSERRGRLLLRLLADWRERAAAEEAARDEEWQRIVKEVAGSGTGLFPAGYLEELRKDWPD